MLIGFALLMAGPTANAQSALQQRAQIARALDGQTSCIKLSLTERACVSFGR
jgi:hypothetical protein